MGSRPKSAEPGSPLLRRALSPDRLHPRSAEKNLAISPLASGGPAAVPTATTSSNGATGLPKVTVISPPRVTILSQPVNDAFSYFCLQITNFIFLFFFFWKALDESGGTRISEEDDDEDEESVATQVAETSEKADDEGDSTATEEGDA